MLGNCKLHCSTLNRRMLDTLFYVALNKVLMYFKESLLPGLVQSDDAEVALLPPFFPP